MPSPAAGGRSLSELIIDYRANKPNFAQHIRDNPERVPEESKPKSEPKSKLPPIKDLFKLSIEQLQALQLEKKEKSTDMPSHPTEENTTGSITDQVAKESKDSTASDHNLHDVNTGVGAQAHKAAPGPVMAEGIGKPEGSKEDRKKKAEELNK